MAKKDKVAIFDFDGVIIDSMALALEQCQKIRNGFTWENYQDAFHLRPPKVGMRDYDHLLKDGEVDDRSKVNQDYVENKVATAMPFEDMPGVIEELYDEVLLAINTNSRGDTTTRVLERLGLRKYFELVTNENKAMSKVDSNNFILQELDVLPEDAVYITDSTGDVIEVSETQVKSIGVTWGIHDRNYFEDPALNEYLVDLIDNPKDLPSAVRKYLKI